MTPADGVFLAGLVAATVGLGCGAWWAWRDRHMPAAALLLALGPMFMVGACFWLSKPDATTGSPFGATRVSLDRVRFNLAPGHEVRIGGDPALDDLVVGEETDVRSLPADLVRLSRDPQGELVLTFTPNLSTVAVAVERDHRRMWLGARRLDAAQLQARSGEVGAPQAGAAYPGRLFSLRAPDGPMQIEPGDLMFARSEGWPARTRLWLREDRPATETLADGDVISIWSAVEPARLLPRGESPVLGGLPLRNMRRLKIHEAGGGLEIGFPTPAVRTFHRTPDAAPSNLRLVSAAGADAALPPSLEPGVFSDLGAAFEPSLAGATLARPLDSRDPLSVAGAGAQIEGRRLTLSDAQGGRAAVFRVETLDFASGLYRWAPWLALLTLGLSLAATWRLRRADPVAAVAFGFLDLCLTLRLLIAVEGAFMDPSLSVQDFPKNALFALAAAPAILLIWWPQGSRWRPHTGLLILAAVILKFAGQAKPEVWLAALIMATARLVLPPLGRRVLRLAPRSALATLTAGVLLILALRGLGRLTTFREAVTIDGHRIALSLLFVPLTLGIFAPLLARLQTADEPGFFETVIPMVAIVAGVIGASMIVKDNGFSIIAWPITVALAAVTLGRSAKPAWRLALEMAMATGLAFAVVSWGRWALLDAPSSLAALVPGLVVAIAVLVLCVRPRIVALPMRRVVALAPALAVLVMCGFVAFGRPLSASPDTPDLAALERYDQNVDRLVGALEPGLLTEIGTTASENFAHTLAHMQAYSASLLPRGWMNAPEPTVLRAYQLDDNVSAIHLMSPFGRLSALVFLLDGAAVGVIALALAMRRGGAQAWWGALAGLTLWLVDAYMVLANCGAAPFTGRNVYLLDPLSTSDLAEGLVLLILVGVGLGAGKASP